jgi:hypothetical protein
MTPIKHPKKLTGHEVPTADVTATDTDAEAVSPRRYCFWTNKYFAPVSGP